MNTDIPEEANTDANRSGSAGNGSEQRSVRDGERISGRDKERTRAAILEAAETLFLQHGNSVSIAEIARTAGVSKSGLLHHFPSKERLIEDLIENALEQYTQVIYAHLDLSENRPGKMLRAYVRALTSGKNRATTLLSHSGLLAKMDQTDRVMELAERDAQRWREIFAADGIPLGKMAVVRGAAESFAVDAESPWLTEEEWKAGREYLLSLAEPD